VLFLNFPDFSSSNRNARGWAKEDGCRRALRRQVSQSGGCRLPCSAVHSAAFVFLGRLQESLPAGFGGRSCRRGPHDLDGWHDLRVCPAGSLLHGLERGPLAPTQPSAGAAYRPRPGGLRWCRLQLRSGLVALRLAWRAVAMALVDPRPGGGRRLWHGQRGPSSSRLYRCGSSGPGGLGSPSLSDGTGSLSACSTLLQPISFRDRTAIVHGRKAGPRETEAGASPLTAGLWPFSLQIRAEESRVRKRPCQVLEVGVHFIVEQDERSLGYLFP
jgi:hypothetical protein